MSKSLELPDIVFDSLVDVARMRGTTPADWVAAQVAGATGTAPPDTGAAPGTLSDLLREIGVYRLARPTSASEQVKEVFGEYVERKHKEAG